MSLLTIAFATTDRSVFRVLDAIRSKTNDRRLAYLVVCQASKDEETAFNELHRLRIERSDFDFVIRHEVGVSRSRNVALSHCNSTFIWFLDDDVEVDDWTLTNKLLSHLETSDADVLLCMIKSTEDRDVYYKDYSYRHKRVAVKRIELLKASSIEIICRIQFTRGHGIMFNEEFGLGARWPSCEENLFLLDQSDAGARMQYYNEALVFHPVSEENRLAENRNHLIARGQLLKRFAFIYRVLLMIRWSLRRGAFSNNCFVRLRALWAGLYGGK